MRRRDDRSASDAISTTVIDAIADHEGVDPLELERPLYDAIDVEALNALFSRSGDTAEPTLDRVVFSYNGYDVRVTGEGDVRVFDSDEG